MARYQCMSCETIQTTGDNEPDACRDCGGPVFDLDRYEASRAEAQIIGAQNDLFRTALGPADWNGQTLRGRVFVTRGILSLGPDFVAAALSLTRIDTNFMDDHGARSFGMPEVPQGGQTIRIYWKIDLYDNDTLMGPEVESDPEQTVRVLTLCLPDEY